MATRKKLATKPVHNTAKIEMEGWVQEDHREDETIRVIFVAEYPFNSDLEDALNEARNGINGFGDLVDEIKFFEDS